MAQVPLTLFLMHPYNVAYLEKKIARPRFPEWSVKELWVMLTFWLISLAIFLILAVPAWTRWLDLHNNGVTTEGQIVDYTVASGNPSGFTVIYSFETNNQTYLGEQYVPIRQFDRVITEEPGIALRYVAHQPDVSQLEAPIEDYYDSREQGTLVGGSFLLIMLGILIVHYDRHSQNSLLIAKGTIIEGTIISAMGNQPERDSAVKQLLTALFSWAWFVLRRRSQMEFKLGIRYKIISPINQKEIFKSESAVRYDLSPRMVPHPGTKIAVLFRTNRHFKML